MRFWPRHWSIATMWCGLQGHFVPTAHPEYAKAATPALVQPGPTTGSLHRCLRCDTWVTSEDPVPDPMPSGAAEPVVLPKPDRGRALDDIMVIRAIAVWRGVHAVFFTILALALIGAEWGLPSLREQANALLQTAEAAIDETRSGNSFLANRLHDLANLDQGTITLLLAVTVFYAVLEGVEAVFLWKLRRWAEYLTVLATAALIPFEIHELMDKITVFRVGALVINIAILAYLVWTKRLFGVRGGTAALEAHLESDVNWDAVLAEAPPIPAKHLQTRLVEVERAPET